VTRFTFAVDESNSALSMPTAHVLSPITTIRAFTSQRGSDARRRAK